MRDSFGMVPLSGKLGEKSESTVRSAGKSWKPGGRKVFVFLVVSPGVLTKEGESQVE